MRFWSGRGPALVVLDGSEFAIDKKTVSQFSPNVAYHHAPYGIFQRMRLATDLVDTEFVALAADDEFYLHDALAACIHELDFDSGLIACCGRSLGFSWNGASVVGLRQYPGFADYNILEASNIDRMKNHMRHYVPSQAYAVCRSRDWLSVFKHITQREFPVFAIGELQFEMCFSFGGKSKVIPHLMWLRSHGETPPIRDTDPSLTTNNKFANWWKNPRQQHIHAEFVGIMADALRSIAPEYDGNYRAAVVEGCEAYVHSYFARTRGHDDLTYRHIFQRIRSIANRFLPDNFKALGRRLTRSHRRTRLQPLSEVAAALATTGVRVNFNELNVIEKIIATFHQPASPLAVR